MDRNIIIMGFEFLKEKKHYNQITVVKKLKYLNAIISGPTLSNILNDKKVNQRTLHSVSIGMQELIKNELGYYWSGHRFEKQEEEEWKPTIIGELDSNNPSLIQKQGFAFYENGRLPIKEKVDFFSNAQKEVIEFGVTLHTFTNYFITRSDWEFRNPVAALLEKPVDFKCYLLDPDCNEARLYFEDRKRSNNETSRGTETIRESITKLRKIKAGFDREGLPGTFRIYTYKHIPNNHFFSIDGGTANGKMLVSHYIYGELRANCPVIEIEKSGNSHLYRKYWNSLQLLTKNAKEIT